MLNNVTSKRWVNRKTIRLNRKSCIRFYVNLSYVNKLAEECENEKVKELKTRLK